MTVLLTTNLMTGQSIAARVHDALPDQYAGMSRSRTTARTIVRGVPDGTDPRVVSRQVDLHAVQMTKRSVFSDPAYVLDYADLPAHDGKILLG